MDAQERIGASNPFFPRGLVSILPEAVARWARLQRELGVDDVVLDQVWKPAVPPARTPPPAAGRPSRPAPETGFVAPSVPRPSAPPPPPRDAAAGGFRPPVMPNFAPPGRAPVAPKPASAPAAAPLRPVATRAAFPTFTSLVELETHAKACQRCVLAKRRKGVVPSGGPEKAEWAVLTLYAWAEDLERGQILAGNYAAPLLEMAKSMGLGAPAATAIFGCTPDDPADTTIQGFTEAVRCRGHWLQRLKLSGCKAILVLDHKATLLARGPSAPVEWPAHRGQRWEIDGIPAISTHHPTRMARQTALIPEVESDVKQILSLVRGGA